MRNRLGEITREFAYVDHMLVMHAQPGGVISHYDYNHTSPGGKVIRTWTNTGQSWNLAYGKSQTIVTDNLGGTERFRFNPQQRFTGKTDALGGKVERELDAFHNVLALSDSSGRTTRYRYDERSRVIQIQDPDSALTHISYDQRFDKPIRQWRRKPEYNPQICIRNTRFYIKQTNKHSHLSVCPDIDVYIFSEGCTDQFVSNSASN